MVNIVKLLRSATLGNRPTGAALVAGAPYVNFAEKQFGVVDSTPTAQDLIGVPFFSTAANYNSGQPINYLGQLYVALSAVTAGAWNPTQWSLVGTTSSAVRYDVAQGLTANQQAQARSNISVLRKNYIINGAMQVSQENGATAGTSSGYFPVDQFSINFSNAGTQTAQQVASVAPSGSPNRFRVTATVADASVGAGDLCFILHRIEGLRTADLRSGTASAKTIIIQFGVKAPAGTYCVMLRNGTPNRSYVAEYIVAAGEANTDVIKSVTMTLDVTGAWATDNTVGLDIGWALMVGSTYQTAAGAWAAGNFVGSANQFNFMGTNGNVFELFDVGLYEGTVAPPFMVPDYASELVQCQRYWRRLRAGIIGAASVTTSLRAHIAHANMRAAPTAAVSAPLVISDTASNPTQSSANVTITGNFPDMGQYEFGNFSGLVATKTYFVTASSGDLTLGARL